MTTTRDDQPCVGAGSAPASVPHVPLDERRYHRLGLLVLLLGLGGFGGWAFTAELSVSVVAPGYVAAESYRRTVQHLEGGIVREILVEDGDSVTAGQPLVVLDDTQARSQLQIMRSQYLIHRATELRLLAEQQGSATLSIPEELTTSDLPRVQEVLALQQALFVARRESHRGALEALDEQVIQLRRQIEGLEEAVRLGERHLASLSAEENDLRGLYSKGLVDNLRLREVERDLLQLEGEVAGRRAEIGRLGSQLSENRMLREVRIQEFHKEVGEQLRDVQARVSEAEERIISLSDQVLRTTIKAPVAGTVVERRVHSIGDVVRPGDSLLDLVPAGDGFIIEARVPGRDVDRLYPGQAAEIRFTAFNQRQTHSSLAEVVYVSADSQTDEATGARFYRVRLRVSDTGRQALDGHMQLLAGMPAEVMIRTGERTFASYLLKPLTDMFARSVREA
ncbi:HlyD family type I secretion periplasmic adaptor subunit [Halomonas sp. MCCC 1A17488]|uniref:Membrane fusion protein (MFP) family protein n=1 Tax=Billgrantia sulfidoxydans TaxID=2733484 RepID=A0ABX7W771_9GAMM|nr:MULTISPECIES: HlyD family type I secretion periplasmic adaptor subunit [Halomonas]MCE8018113.1 HlyD family type I secretion periplasmic adaptor subunit [Halomonas sp. MCCC 1A17488]MCG3241446.1 HlyD family type I secretion periplasmic adaptor subunit [Halomonas sp. MCCC 1A17488]QPP48595.1 HlyD family type I secretion periplasmic adaptor subunit [Halomonas sp. SS10-MC5]QTP55940.1 HlyD family type I secretion periplasmic adaptor subunit [Halomonas sulfidoxydans]